MQIDYPYTKSMMAEESAIDDEDFVDFPQLWKVVSVIIGILAS